MRGHLFLIDCGEGTQVELRRHKIKFNQIKHVFISHLHGDHYFGLVGLISTFRLLTRETSMVKTIKVFPNPCILFATVALNGAKNAGILAAQIIGASDKCVLDKILIYKEGLKAKVLEASKKIKS